MANPLQIYIDDTSPSVAYYPFADTFGPPDLLAGWNPYYTNSGYTAYQGQIGEGTSLHRTSLDGASLSIQWLGAYHFTCIRWVLLMERYYRHWHPDIWLCLPSFLQLNSRRNTDGTQFNIAGRWDSG
jgi:hypothetical protein